MSSASPRGSAALARAEEVPEFAEPGDIPKPAEATPQGDDALARFDSFHQVIGLIRANRDMHLLIEVETHVHLARYAPGRIEFRPGSDAPRDLASRLAQRLTAWTGVRWTVAVVNDAGAPTIAQTRDADRRGLEDRARAHPLVQAVFAAFPQARITAVRTPDAVAAEAAVTALPEVPDEWDPFDD
jgi:DNA polymerase-3 subunit gamma/tau